MSHWWIEAGYHPFKKGDGNFPRPGEVILYYRTRAHMSQSDLAVQLKMAQPEVANMENGIRRIGTERRWLLCKILSIPPLLLGVTTVDEIEKRLNLQSLTIEEHKAYLEEAKKQQYSGSMAGIAEINDYHTLHIYGELPHASRQTKKQLENLLFEYHLLSANALSVQVHPSFSKAFGHINRASTFAETDELKVVCTLQMGDIFNEMGNFEESLCVFEEAQTYKNVIPDHLNGIRLLWSAPLMARQAQDYRDKMTALSAVDQAGRMIRASSPLFVHGFDYSIQKYHLKKAESLIHIGGYEDALDELNSIQCNPVGWWQLQRDLLGAEANLNLKEYPDTVSYLEAALATIKVFNSEFIAHAQSIHRRLLSGPYGKQSDVARLGDMLGTREAVR